MLLTFSGLDGSGKSTLIAGLSDVLARRGRQVRVLTMYDHVGLYAVIRGLRDTARGRRRPPPPAAVAPSPPAAAEAEPSAPAWLAMLRTRSARRITYWLDLALFQLYRVYQERVRGRILILDRYFYDSILELGEQPTDAELTALLRWVPTPDVPIYVDAAPEIAFARKREYTVERLTARAGLYKRIFATVDGALVVSNQNAPASVALERIQERVLSGLPV